MAKHTQSRMYRELAENLLETIVGGDVLSLVDTEREELVTSLVRQWLTYDGNAALFVEDSYGFFVVERSPLGRPLVKAFPGDRGWLRRVASSWKIDEGLMTEVADQLNRGQSAEVTTDDGDPVRIWVNPKERKCGVEPLNAQPQFVGKPVRDYRTIALDPVERILGPNADEQERDMLAESMVNQWKRFQGHAAIFSGPMRHDVVFRELEHGKCVTEALKLQHDLGAWFRERGLQAELIPEVVARINLAQEVEIENRQGVRSRVWFDPKAGQLYVRVLGQPQPPVFCPKCQAVLRPWRDGEDEQTCVHCNELVAIGPEAKTEAASAAIDSQRG